ncbi:MAG: T9SS type A sorting domain-containing protein, partial [Bacteroidia bacterium]
VSSNYTQVCVGEPVALVASGANTYTWNTGLNTPIIIVTPTATTVYSVSSQNTNGCSATASITIIASICEGLAQNNIAALKLYPQPAHSILYIDSPLKGQITLLDLQGRIHTQMPLEIGHNNLTLAGLQAGYYLLRLNSETGLQYQGIYIY